MTGRHYLDHASTAPLRPEARDAMVTWLTGAEVEVVAGDPGRIHAEGLHARVVVEDARAAVARLTGARSREVVFTSGATESIASATFGAVTRALEAGQRPHVVFAAVEHSAVRQAAEQFAVGGGGDVTVVGVDRRGRIDPDELLAAVRPDTALVHVQWGNHEVGTLQPIEAVVAGCRARGVLVHVDAAQAVGRVPVDFVGLGADLLSASGHKFGGPPGTGVLLVRRGLRLAPLLRGGDQERARRAGLENVPALAGLGAAAAALTTAADPGSSDPGPVDRLRAEEAEARRLTDRLRAGLGQVPGVVDLGPADPSLRLPHLVCVGIEGVEPQGVLLGLDQAGVAAHSGSSCSSESLEPSPVLAAMGVDADRSLRLSVGWDTTDDDVDAALVAVNETVARLRALAR